MKKRDKIIQRQAIAVSPKELRKIADEIEKDHLNFGKETGIKLSLDKKSLVFIINKTKEMDTWEFE